MQGLQERLQQKIKGAQARAQDLVGGGKFQNKKFVFSQHI